MKLKDGFVTHDVCGKQIAVAKGEVAHVMRGMVKSNSTAAFIFNCLMSDTTEETIVKAIVAEYDASEEVVAKDVHRIIEQLRSEGLLNE